MANLEEGNKTSIAEFILLGLGILPELQTFLFLLFLAIYLLTVAGSLLIVVLVVADSHIHTPMYFFLGNPSCLETCYSSTLLPKMLAGLLTGNRTISFCGCFTQYYFFASLVGTECLLLSVMSYHRYLAICHPLHDATRMNFGACLWLAGGSWIGGFLCNTITTLSVSQLTFCGPNTISHCYCDLVPLIHVSCSDSQMMETLIFLLILIFLNGPVSAHHNVLHLHHHHHRQNPIHHWRQKAFSTCSSHLIVVTIYYGTLLAVSMFPTTDLLGDFKKVLSVVYTLLTPLANPLIYSLRNKEVREALRRVIRKFMFV